MTNENRTDYTKYWLFWLAVLLFILCTYIFYLIWRAEHRGLIFVMLDVGQGDALFIESPTGAQILVDAGPPKKVMSKLSKLMPFFDKKLDAIIITNPDADHIGGFADVLKVYKVGQVFEPGTFNESDTYENLKAQIENKNIPTSLAKRGMRIDIGGGAVIDILFPDRDVSLWTTNDGSMVAKLTYGKTSVMLTGDSTRETERIILAENTTSFLDSSILKVGHHGSRTSTSAEFVEALSPTYALISEGLDNKYGHPHEETLATLIESDAKVFRTDSLGTIIMKSDGEKETFSFKK